MKVIGVLLMAVPLLWLLVVILRALYRKQNLVEVDLLHVFIALACWMAGRVVAGEGLGFLILEALLR